MAVIRPNDLPAAASVSSDDELVIDTGAAVQKATPGQIVDAAAPLATQAEAEAGTDNAKRVTPLRVKQAIDALGVSAENLASTDAGKGAALVAVADGRSVQQYIADQGVYNAGIEGVSASASAVDNALNLQAAIDHVLTTGGLVLELPPGEIEIDGDVIVNSFTTDSPLYSNTLVIKGAGCGTNGTWLHFTSGSLRVRTSNHWLRDLRVTSDDADGIVIEPQTSPVNRYPVRSGMENVRAEYCAASGITFEDCWIYTMVNCYARFNAVAGIEGKAGALSNLACNNLNIIGGEFQGNGTIVGTSGSGGTSKGTGAGVITGRCVQFSMLNSAIEGNYGDGLVFSEQLRGCTLMGVYFEKNGSHPDNCDIYGAQPSSSANGPNSVFIVNSNFTPQILNGTAQIRAIDVYDVQDLKIVNPQFYSLGSPLALYSAEPIRVQESTAGRCTGWVEGYFYGSLSYTQDVLDNNCERFGRPRKSLFCPALAMPDGATTTTGPFVVPMPATAGYRATVNHITIPATWTGATPSGAGTGVGRIITTIRRGMAGTTVSGKTDDVNYASSTSAVRTTNNTSSSAMPGTFVLVTVAREGGNAADTLTADVTLMALEIITYEGVVSARST